jgi:NADH dehydrogenase [ubiquinone] 1 alpha subcomplex assembly factor 1
MKYLFLFALFGCSSSKIGSNANTIIFNFNSSSKITDWRVINDGVMGGVSSSSFYINKDGHGLFSGKVSTENNGGFASIRYSFQELVIGTKTKIALRVKGDSKSYQLRIKSKSADYYSYVQIFETSTEWKTIEIKLADMYPSYRGKKLTKNNFEEASIEEISILIGNKRNESFKLLIDQIELI